MAYVDGFIIAVPKDMLDNYKALAQECMPIWKEFGATGYAECVGDDVPYGELTSFPRAVQAKDDEVVIFSWIIYPSKEVRDAANLKIMQDPRIEKMMNPPPFDGKRMIHGGFQPFVGP